MEILINDLVNKIKSVFDDTKVYSVETVYEKTNSSDEFKLVISMNKVLYDDINIIYTKIIFITDSNKTKLNKNYFTYLYDINCEYVRVEFSDIEDMSVKISNIFNDNKFGKDIKILSNFVKSPSTIINKWFEKNDIADMSVINVDNKKISIVPCKELRFNFILKLNNNQDIDLTIFKEGKNDYIYDFNIFDVKFQEKRESLTNLVETIGTSLKNNVKN